MQYDLEMIVDLCDELRFPHRMPTSHEVLIELEASIELVFLNFPEEDDCLMGFSGTEWHTHGDVEFSDQHGNYIELTYLDVLTGLADGAVLLCELWRTDGLSDRWVTHKDFVDEFRFLQMGDEIRVRPLRHEGLSGQ
jgi:hypothetical protein